MWSKEYMKIKNSCKIEKSIFDWYNEIEPLIFWDRTIAKLTTAMSRPRVLPIVYVCLFRDNECGTHKSVKLFQNLETQNLSFLLSLTNWGNKLDLPHGRKTNTWVESTFSDFHNRCEWILEVQYDSKFPIHYAHNNRSIFSQSKM